MLTLNTSAQDPSAVTAINTLMGVVAEIREAAVKEKLNHVQAITLMYKVDKLKELLSDAVKSPLEEVYNSLKFNIVPSLMEDIGVTATTVEGVGRCNTIDDIRTSVEDKDALMKWLVENELEDMISQQVNAQTLTAFARKRLKTGDPLPPAVKVTPFVRAQITRA